MNIADLPISEQAANAINKILAAYTSCEPENAGHTTAANNYQKIEGLLNRVFPLSDFICSVALRHPEKMLQIFARLVQNEAPYEAKDYTSNLSQILQSCETEESFYRELRVFRQIEMASIAIHDLLKLQDIIESMQHVSQLAEAIIAQAYLWLHPRLCDKYGTPEDNQDLQIMAMGKFGGGELNFSSDIDLIFAYPSAGETQSARKPIEHQTFFTRLAQKLIYALDHINAYGRCYRVDMRLRPMGESGPLVIPFAALESYYQDQGRAWERYAMQKMRIIDINSKSTNSQSTKDSAALYKLIQPFVYRKYIDFTTIDAIREMKILIEKEVRRRQLFDNIKLGKGGIREVEFFVQAFQLIHAGREPSCQQVSTLGALDALCKCEFIEKDSYHALRKEYLYLRKIEHFLQMFNDEQTQVLPQDPINQQRLTYLLGFESYQSCLNSVSESMVTINQHFQTIIQDANQVQDADSEPSEDQLIFTDAWNIELEEHEMATLLAPKLAQAEAAVLFQYIKSFKDKLRSASLSERGMRSINRLMPMVLSELSFKNNMLNRNQVEGIFGILLTITGRITYIDLLLENPSVRARLNELCRKSLWVAQEIAQHPMLLDELLHPVYLQPDTLPLADWKQRCADELEQFMLRVEPEDIEAIMDTLRQFKLACQLRIAAADISGTIAINQVSDKLSILAEVILAEVLKQSWRQVTQKFGIPQGKSITDKGIGIVAYGKFGGIELSYGSDLDIVCLYDAIPDGETDSSGLRNSISHQDFYVKLVQKLTHFCITKTYHGILYEIDLRLRPSGNSGLLITHIQSFAEYQNASAWTWEHQAVVRSRMVFGSEHLCHVFENIRRSILCIPRDAVKLNEEVSEMRAKMQKHLDNSNDELVDIKQCSGGIVDIEFMVQFWVLNFASLHEELCRWSDNLRILDTCAQVKLLSESEASQLQQHYLWLRHLSHRLQLSDRKMAEHSDTLDNIKREVDTFFRKLLIRK